MAAKPKAQSAFDEVKDKIKAGIKDLATLDVTTLTGDVTVVFEESGAGKSKILADPSGLFEALSGKIADGSWAKLVGHTHIEFDFDSVTIVGDGVSPELSEAHSQAVKAAQDARLGVFRLVKEVVS